MVSHVSMWMQTSCSPACRCLCQQGTVWDGTPFVIHCGNQYHPIIPTWRSFLCFGRPEWPRQHVSASYLLAFTIWLGLVMLLSPSRDYNFLLIARRLVHRDCYASSVFVKLKYKHIRGVVHRYVFLLFSQAAHNPANTYLVTYRQLASGYNKCTRDGLRLLPFKKIPLRLKINICLYQSLTTQIHEE